MPTTLFSMEISCLRTIPCETLTGYDKKYQAITETMHRKNKATVQNTWLDNFVVCCWYQEWFSKYMKQGIVCALKHDNNPRKIANQRPLS